MKKTLELNNEKTLEIDINIFTSEEHPIGCEPLVLTKLLMITELTITANGKKVSGIYHDNYLNLHSIHFYTDESNPVFYDERIANIANNNTNFSYILKVGDAYVMLTDDEYESLTTSIEKLKEAETKEKGYYDSIKKALIEDAEKELSKVKEELSKIEEYMNNNELLSDTENEIMKENYKNLMFEGGEGEYPYAPSKETYEYECKHLKELEYKLEEYQAGILFRVEVK